MSLTKRVTIIRKGNWEKVLTLPDLHVPHEDPIAVDLALRFTKDFKPDILIAHEWEDFHDVSSFDKDPSRMNADNLQQEFDKANEYRGLFADAAKGARKIYLWSNHFQRFQTHLNHNTPALSCLRGMDIKELMELSKHGFEYMDVFENRKVLYKHGNLISSDSCMTARREFAAEGMTGVTGHSHRQGVFFKTVRGGNYKWVESGCLCKIDPPYNKSSKVYNWQQGFSTTIHNKDGEGYDIRLATILKDKFWYGDTLYKHKGGT